MKTRLLFFAMLMLGIGTLKAQIPCNPNFTYTVNPSGVVTFTGTVTTSATTYTWSFGNGTSGTGINTSCYYNAPGNYTVCLYVADTSMLTPCFDSSCVTITVSSTSPTCVAAFTSTALSTPYSYDFTNISTGTAPLTFDWSWNDGTPNSSLSNPSHTFPGPGTYTVCLHISSGSGCIDSTCQVITVGSTGGGCAASFYVYEDTSAGATAHTYVGVNNSTSPGVIGTYFWSWGDGTSSTGPYPSHTYASAGTYNICLVIQGPSCVDSFCLSQIINKKDRVIHKINFQAPSGLNNVSKTQANIYPNPAHDKLFIKGDAAITYQIEIYNVNGTKVLSSSIKGNQFVNISNLPNNLYTVKISDLSGKSQFAKFMKD